MKLKLLVSVMGILLLSLSIMAKGIVRTKQIDFGPVGQQTTLVGIIKGYNTIEYKFHAKSNQTLHLNMETDTVYFNVIGPNKGPLDGAMFVGKSEGKSYVHTLTKNGIYTVKVYLLHDEAENDEKILYVMEIGLE